MVTAYIQILIYGLINGALYGLVGLGLALVFGVMSYLNVAHGALIMIASYACFWLFHLLKVDPFLSSLLIVPCFFLLGVIIYKILFDSLKRFPEGQKTKNSLLISFGLLLILSNLVTILWTADERAVTPHYAGFVIQFFGLRIPYIGIGAVLFAVVVSILLDLFLSKTYFGKGIRAASQDHEAAAMMGINVGTTYLISFGIGVALAGIPGIIVSLSSFNPSLSFELTNKALVVIILAGVGSVYGVLLGGFALGLAEAIGVLFIGATYREVIGLVLFVLFLLLRPQGLMGKRS
ncbi:MAG: branched-chain amino acid ABC transporter permease [Syntrophorhabdaceae bacterium]|nr:branched-chain amino acid ABC transporter permease [Syntrophorhabdaceae bacterium]